MELQKYSNIEKAQKNAYKYLGKTATLYESTRKDKKYMIKNDEDKWVHFGQLGYEDYTKHNDNIRRQNYLKRASNIKGNWRNDKYSPNNLSINILW
jgi:hypothetical protein